MKRQGKEGFTWDSEAEEWAAWADSCIEHDLPRTRQARDALRSMWMGYLNEAALVAHTAPAIQYVDPYSAIQWPETTDRLEYRLFLIAGILALGLAAAIWWMG